jgi:type VI protein secretion system component VasF
MSDERPANLLAEFDRLLSGWLAIRDQLTQGLVGLNVDTPEANQVVGRTNDALIALLRQIDEGLEHYPKGLSKDLERVHYAFVAYCDDFLLQEFSWGNKNQDEARRFRRGWLKMLLEQQVFGTRAAGVKLEQEMSRVITKGYIEPSDAALALIYLKVIWVGFGLHSQGFQDKRGLIREQLSEVASRVSPKQVDESRLQPLGWMPAEGITATRLAPISRWKMLIVYFSFGFVTVLSATWMLLSLWVTLTLEN